MLGSFYEFIGVHALVFEDVSVHDDLDVLNDHLEQLRCIINHLLAFE